MPGEHIEVGGERAEGFPGRVVGEARELLGTAQAVLRATDQVLEFVLGGG